MVGYAACAKLYKEERAKGKYPKSLAAGESLLIAYKAARQVEGMEEMIYWLEDYIEHFLRLRASSISQSSPPHACSEDVASRGKGGGKGPCKDGHSCSRTGCWFEHPASAQAAQHARSEDVASRGRGGGKGHCKDGASWLREATDLFKKAAQNAVRTETVFALPARFFGNLLANRPALMKEFACKIDVQHAQHLEVYDTVISGQIDDVDGLQRRLVEDVRKWEAADTLAEKVNVEKRYERMFVGKKWVHMHAMEEQTGARISEDRRGQGPTGFSCQGEAEQVGACLQLLRQRLEEVQRTCDIEEVVYIDRGLVGLLIGRQGAGIAHIKQETGCQISVEKSADDVSGQSVVKIWGHGEGVRLAKLRVASVGHGRSRTPAPSHSWSGSSHRF